MKIVIAEDEESVQQGMDEMLHMINPDYELIDRHGYRRAEGNGADTEETAGSINNCKFKGKIVPGDKVRLETRIIKRKGPMGVGRAEASVDGKIVVSAELTFMVGQAGKND